MGKIYEIQCEKTTRQGNVMIHTLDVVSCITGEVFRGVGKATCDPQDKFDYGFGAELAREKALYKALRKFTKETSEYLLFAQRELIKTGGEVYKLEQSIEDLINCNC